MFTRVLDGAPVVPPNEIEKVEIYKNKLLSKKSETYTKSNKKSKSNNQTSFAPHQQEISALEYDDRDDGDIDILIDSFLQDEAANGTHFIDNTTVDTSSSNVSNSEIATQNSDIFSYSNLVNNTIIAQPSTGNNTENNNTYQYVDNNRTFNDTNTLNNITNITSSNSHITGTTTNSTTTATSNSIAENNSTTEHPLDTSTNTTHTNTSLNTTVIKDITRYTYNGVFSVEINTQNIVTKMNFDFSITIEGK